MQGWLQEGFPPEKLVLGTAGFARTFTLASRPRGTGVGQAVITVGVPGNFSDTEGLLTYQEVWIIRTAYVIYQCSACSSNRPGGMDNQQINSIPVVPCLFTCQEVWIIRTAYVIYQCSACSSNRPVGMDNQQITSIPVLACLFTCQEGWIGNM